MHIIAKKLLWSSRSGPLTSPPVQLRRPNKTTKEPFSPESSSWLLALRLRRRFGCARFHLAATDDISDDFVAEMSERGFVEAMSSSEDMSNIRHFGVLLLGRLFRSCLIGATLFLRKNHLGSSPSKAPPHFAKGASCPRGLALPVASPSNCPGPPAQEVTPGTHSPMPPGMGLRSGLRAHFEALLYFLAAQHEFDWLPEAVSLAYLHVLAGLSALPGHRHLEHPKHGGPALP